MILLTVHKERAHLPNPPLLSPLVPQPSNQYIGWYEEGIGKLEIDCIGWWKDKLDPSQGSSQHFSTFGNNSPAFAYHAPPLPLESVMKPLQPESQKCLKIVESTVLGRWQVQSLPTC